MRTTPNLDDDVAGQIKGLSRQQRRSMSRVADELIRAARPAGRAPAMPVPYTPPSFDTGRA